MKLLLHPGLYAVCRLDPGAELPAWALRAPMYFVARTVEELSVVCPRAGVPEGVKNESGWRMLQVAGHLDFGLTGILASIANPLAAAGVSLFALSTFNTDYVIVKEERLAAAKAALEGAGFAIVEASAG